MKCANCTDRLIADGGSYPETDLPDAVTQAPVMQQVSTGGMLVTGLIAIPVCFGCREKMLRSTSKTGLALG